ncbi:MAG TPA: 5'-nucleotidase C-terminal domain-containing protein [Anaerolineales bacterium]
MHELMFARRSTASYRMPLLRLFSAILIAALSVIGSSGSSAFAAPRPTVDIQILAVSDWHAQLDPISVFGVGDVGGAAVLSSYWNEDRAINPNTLTLTAGDAYGASPPLSGFFEEEPAIHAMNLMGFDADTFGNHNFDRGIAHLQQMIDLADFQYVSANLKNRDDNLTDVKDYEIFEVGGVKVAVIGITNPEAPNLVFPGNFGTIEPTDPIPAANKARARAKAEGAQVFIAITHLGVTGFDPVTGAATGPLIDFVDNVGGFNLIFGDHTDVQYSAIHNNALVVENRSKGVTYSKSVLTVDPQNGRIADRTNTFVTPLSSAVTPDPAIVAMLAPYRAALSAAFDAPIGVATGLFPRGGNIERSGEVAIGNLIADALRLKYGTQLALTNGGGIRAPLPSSYLPADLSLRRNSPGYAPGPPFDLVVGDAFAVLPFGNSVVTRTVTGAQLWEALENGVSQINSATCLGADGRFPQISGFKFTFQCSLPAGSRVLSVAFPDDMPIPPDSTTYTFATNDFVNAGGDFYTMFADGQGTTREVMADVVLEYIEGLGTITPTIEGRITKLP